MILLPLESAHAMGVSLAKGRRVGSVGFGRGVRLIEYRVLEELVVEQPAHRNFTC